MGLRNKIYYSFLITFLLVMLTKNSFSQSNHYWMQNFNTESSLLAGAVVGGEAGPSAVYYNPALINQDESHKFALSANLLSFQSMTIENPVGTGTEFSKFIFQVQPKFISYAGSPKKKSKITYEFAFLVPLTNNIKFSYFHDDELDIIKRLDGPEDYVGEITYRNHYNDYYVGGGLSHILSDIFTVGASMFVSIKTLEYRNNVVMKAMQNTDTVYSNGEPEPFYFAQNSYSEQLKYWDVSVLFKLGFHFQSKNGNWGVGLNFTTPNLHIYGEADVKKEFYRGDVFNDKEGVFTENRAFAGLQQDIGTNIKDPFSIALGLVYKTPNRKNSIMLTSEYFFEIGEYALLETTNSKVVGNVQPDNVSDVMNYITSANAILNVGVGFVQYINEQLTINGGFKTDFNALTGQDQKFADNINEKPRLSDLIFDKFHVIAGPRLDVKRFGIVLGIQYTWGRQDNLYNMVNFADAVEYNPVTGQSLQGVRQQNMKLSYNEFSLFFGVTYGFGQ